MIHPYSAILFRSKRKSIIKPGNTCYEVASVVSDPVRTQRRQPTRLCCPRDSPGKNTREGCHFLLQCMKVKSEREVAQLCPTLSNPMDCSPPDFSIHGIFQAKVLEWGAIAFSRNTWRNLKSILLSERSQSENSTYYVIPTL